MVMLGHSYLLVHMSRACDAHSSPRRNCRTVGLILGFDVKRAETAHTERTSTGGKESFLPDVSVGHTMRERRRRRRRRRRRTDSL